MNDGDGLSSERALGFHRFLAMAPAHHRTIWLGGAMLLACVLLQAPQVFAARLLESDVVLDGSVEPPGDRIDLLLFLATDEQEVTVEIRPYAFTGEDNTPQQVRARGESNRDADGGLRIAALIRREGKHGISTLQVAVPFSDFDLPVGTHRIGYEIRVLHKGVIVFAQATPLTRLTITEATRTEIRQPVAGPAATEKKDVPALILGERQRGGEEAPVEERGLEITVTTPAESAEVQVTPVEIPGEFRRDEEPVDAPQPPEGGSLDEELEALQDEPWKPASDVLGPDDRIVSFATNRKQLAAGADMSIQFGNELLDDLICGTCVVNFPVRHHQKGGLEQPTWWESLDPRKHMLIERISIATLAELLSDSNADDVLIYVHGFNNSFESAVLRAAQMQYDLEFDGRMIAFSWPSMNSVNEYETDAAHAAQSVAALVKLLRSLIEQQRSGASTGSLNVLAHSMGSRILMEALYELHQSGAIQSGETPFDQIVLAAPDLGAARFNNLSGFAALSARQTTYYYCTTDAALGVSRKLNSYEPVGLYPLFMPGLRTINADGVDTTFLNHGYFASSPQVLLDLQLMFEQGLEPDDRMPPLASRTVVFGHPHWSFIDVDVRMLETRR